MSSTNKNLTRQTIFNRAVTGLVKQGQQARNTSGDCQYRGHGGTKCALGLLIPDKHYNPDAEGTMVVKEDHTKDVVYYMCKASGINLDFEPTRNLVADLQDMHDNYMYNLDENDDFVTYIKHKSAEIAAKHDLTPVTF
jgi:hypothetical protein